jgi:hypothetical protein
LRIKRYLAIFAALAVFSCLGGGGAQARPTEQVRIGPGQVKGHHIAPYQIGTIHFRVKLRNLINEIARNARQALAQSNSALNQSAAAIGTANTALQRADQALARQQTPGPQGPAGVSGYQLVRLVTGLSNAVRRYDLPCPTGKVATGGGHNITDLRGTPDPTLSSYPFENGRGWTVAVEQTSGRSADSFALDVWAICANAS